MLFERLNSVMLQLPGPRFNYKDQSGSCSANGNINGNVESGALGPHLSALSMRRVRQLDWVSCLELRPVLCANLLCHLLSLFYFRRFPSNALTNQLTFCSAIASGFIISRSERCGFAKKHLFVPFCGDDHFRLAPAVSWPLANRSDCYKSSGIVGD